MSYLPSVLAVLTGVLLLLLFLVRSLRSLRTMRRAQAGLRRTVADRGGLLRARLAAVEVALRERRASRGTHGGDTGRQHTDENRSTIHVQPRHH